LIRASSASIRFRSGRGSASLGGDGVGSVVVVEGGEVAEPLGELSEVTGGGPGSVLAGGVTVVSGLVSKGGEDVGLVVPEVGDTLGVGSGGPLLAPALSVVPEPVVGGAAGKG